MFFSDGFASGIAITLLVLQRLVEMGLVVWGVVELVRIRRLLGRRGGGVVMHGEEVRGAISRGGVDDAESRALQALQGSRRN